MTPQTTTRPAPFALADPADEALFWQQDKMHFPDRLSPMESAMIQEAIGHGFSHGIRAYDAPLEGMQVRTINGYQYQAMVPMMGTPEQMAAQGARAEAAVPSAGWTSCGPSRSCRRSASTSASGTPSTSKARRATPSPRTSPRPGSACAASGSCTSRS